MTDLDERLATALQRRAESAEGVALSPGAVRHAAGRARARARRMTAAVAVLVMLPVGGFVLGVRQHPASPTAKAVRPLPAGVVASLPWAGAIDLTLRRGGTDGSALGWSFCFGASCTDIAPAGPHSVSLAEQATTVQGLAPAGSARVTVAVEDGPALNASVSAISAGGSPGVLFAAPDVVISRPQGSAFSSSYLVTAYDAAGRQLAVRRSLGGWDLAEQHPAAGPVAVVDDPGPADPSLVVWSDAQGWTCWGQRAGTGAAAIFGAYSCVPPGSPGRLTLVADDLTDGFLLVQAPSSVVRLEVRDASGRTMARASMHAVGSGRLVVIDRSAAGSTPGSTITALDADGRILVQVPTGSLELADGTQTSS